MCSTGINARLEKISRGFGGDNAVYYADTGRLTVCVSWACLHPHETVVSQNGKLVATFSDQEYIQPHIALFRLGYNVIGVVDFCTGKADFNAPVEYVEYTDCEYCGIRYLGDVCCGCGNRL